MVYLKRQQVGFIGSQCSRNLVYMVNDLSGVKIYLYLNYVTGFQLILWAGHCFDLAVKQIIMTLQAGMFHNGFTYTLCRNLI